MTPPATRLGAVGLRVRGVGLRGARHVIGAAAPLALVACTMVGGPIAPGPGERPSPTVDAPPPDPRPRIDVRETRVRLERSFDEVRALWVVRFTMTSEESARAMVERASQAGINTLIVQVRGRADAFYRSSLEPRAEPMRASRDFDPLEFVIEEAHKRGMAVHAWVNTHLVWGPAELPRSPTHMVRANPEWLAVPRDLAPSLAAVDPRDPAYVRALVRYAEERPETVEGLYSSPSHPAVQDRVHSIWLDLARRYDLDGIHFDYIRFPSEDFDYSLGALERFRLWARPQIPAARFGALDASSMRDLFAFVDGEPELWAEFRRTHISDLVRRIYRDVKQVRPDLLVSAAVVPEVDRAYGSRFQDWTAWLEDGILDIAVPMAYTTDSDRFGSLIRTARDAAGERRRVWAGIGAYLNTEEGTLGMIDRARAEDAGGVVLFSYDWAVGEGRGDPEDPLLERIGRERFGGR